MPESGVSNSRGRAIAPLSQAKYLRVEPTDRIDGVQTVVDTDQSILRVWPNMFSLIYLC